MSEDNGMPSANNQQMQLRKTPAVSQHNQDATVLYDEIYDACYRIFPYASASENFLKSLVNKERNPDTQKFSISGAIPNLMGLDPNSLTKNDSGMSAIEAAKTLKQSFDHALLKSGELVDVEFQNLCGLYRLYQEALPEAQARFPKARWGERFVEIIDSTLCPAGISR